jgi:AraC-like DNA-binding protein
MEGFHDTRFGRERCEGEDLPRHRHRNGYVTLILSGRYLEAGDAGRFRAGPGDLLVHRPFESHLDRFEGRSADVINLPLPVGAGSLRSGRVVDADAVARLAERDALAAAGLAVASAAPVESERDWPDLLAASLASARPFRLGEWAHHQGLAAATVSRGFRQVFGTSPERFRAEARARLAWRAACTGGRSLADIACELGFADQPHMTRAVKALTARSPGGWRGSLNCVQDLLPDAA